MSDIRWRGKWDRPKSGAGVRLPGKATYRGHMFALREIAVQDWRGGRGFAWRFAAPVEFGAAVIAGMIVSLFDRDSDRLRG